MMLTTLLLCLAVLQVSLVKGDGVTARYGISTAICDNYLVVGSAINSAYSYTMDADAYSLQSKLVNPDSAINEYGDLTAFGDAVAVSNLDGSTPYMLVGDRDARSVYIYTPPTYAVPTAAAHTKDTFAHDQFGGSIVARGKLVVVSWLDGIFVTIMPTLADFGLVTNTVEITNPNFDLFLANKIAADSSDDGTTGIIAFSSRNNCGVIVTGREAQQGCTAGKNQINIYTYTVAGGVTSTNGVPDSTTLVDPTQNQQDGSSGYGYSIAIAYPNYIVVGAPGTKGSVTGQNTNVGRVILYKYTPSGGGSSTWEVAQNTLNDPSFPSAGDATENGYFGADVAMRTLSSNPLDYVMVVSQPAGVSGGDTPGSSVGNIWVYTYKSGATPLLTNQKFANFACSGYERGVALALSRNGMRIVAGTSAAYNNDGSVVILNADASGGTWSASPAIAPPTASPTMSPTISQSPTPAPPPTGSKSNEEGGGAGPAVGGSIGGLLVLAGLFYFYSLKKDSDASEAAANSGLDLAERTSSQPNPMGNVGNAKNSTRSTPPFP